MKSDKDVTKIKRVTFFLRHSVRLYTIWRDYRLSPVVHVFVHFVCRW